MSKQFGERDLSPDVLPDNDEDKDEKPTPRYFTLQLCVEISERMMQNLTSTLIQSWNLKLIVQFFACLFGVPFSAFFIFVFFVYYVKSNLCTTASLGAQKNWPLFKSGRYPGTDREKLLYTLAGWGLGRSLLTGGRCSEVAVNTGLTVIASLTSIHTDLLIVSRLPKPQHICVSPKLEYT